MTDGDFRDRLNRLQRGDSVSAALRTLMCLQFAAVFLIAGPLTDPFAWMACALLVLLPVSWVVGAFQRRRDGRGGPEVVRRRYEGVLAAAIEKARKRKDHVLWQGSAAVLLGGAVVFLPMGRLRDVSTVLSLLLFLASLDAWQQWKKVLPRLQRELGEFRDHQIGLSAP